MGTLTYSMQISLDGYIEDPTGDFAFAEPDEEVHRVANQHAQQTAAFLFGRRMYEVMEDFWASPERVDGGEVEAEFHRAYVAAERIVFSDTLDSVPDGCRIVRSADAVAEVARLKKGTDGILGVGGAGLAAALVDQIDEINPFVVPTVVGGGKPFFPPGDRLDLALVEHRVFPASGWAYLRYTVSR